LKPRRKRQRATGRRTRAVETVRVGGVVLKNPEKILWPAHGRARAVTKRDYARYLKSVAPRMLLHVAGRPLSLLRGPNGIRRETFFQRHLQSRAAAPLLSLKLRGAEKPFVGVRNAKALIALAQAGALEIHPWGCKAGAPNVPERIVFDLDPAPGLSFVRVVDAAKEVAAVLRVCGLVPFVKTTGGKGLHVVVPIRGASRKSPGWPDARAFAEALCKTLQRDRPSRYTINPRKSARRGKIFLDYLRNARAATSVAPWSARARPGAPVAMPLRWTQLRDNLDPARFTIATLKAFLRQPDPWRNLSRSARSLPKAMRRLERLAKKRARPRLG